MPARLLRIIQKVRMAGRHRRPRVAQAGPHLVSVGRPPGAKLESIARWPCRITTDHWHESARRRVDVLATSRWWPRPTACRWKELANIVSSEDIAWAFFILTALSFALAVARTLSLWSGWDPSTWSL